MNEAIKTLRTWVEGSDNIVFFGGAGVSTESGIPDFRSVDGLYHQTYKYPPETILSHTFFLRNTADFYDFYRDKMLPKGVKPNAAHLALARLEAAGKLRAVITQNIDGLHQAAGSKNVLELHGSTLRNFCMRCKRFYPAEYIEAASGIPKCECGGTIKPDVVLYEEPLNQRIWQASVAAIANADLMIVGGTSLTVYPAAGLVEAYDGKKLVLINRDATALDSCADLIIRGSIGEVLGSL